MAMNPEPGKLTRQAKILLLCLVVLASFYYIQRQSDPDFNPWNYLFPGEIDHKQDLRNKYAKYRAGRLSASRMLDACTQKLMYAEKGKDALAEYAYALRSQVYLDEGDPEAALVEARKAADIAPSPGRGAVALGDALRALGKDDEAAGAYRQATSNPDYVPDYTIEDPMDARTLEALLAADKRNYEEWELENVTVRGKLAGFKIMEFYIPVFMLEGRAPHCNLICLVKDDELSAKAGNLMDGAAAILAKTYGLSFATQGRNKFIILNGTGSLGSKMTVMDDCVILKIEH